MINMNIYPSNCNITFTKFQILYLYNNQEKNGYNYIKSFSLDIDVWKFLYVNP